MDTPILISFGSNIDPLPNLLQGLTRLHQALGLAAISNVYRTTPVPDPRRPPPPGRESPPFLNGAVRSEATITPAHLHELLRRIEQEAGRVRGPDRFAPRPLDLDIALMGSRILDSGPPTLPDPDITRLPFLAVTLAEVAPEARHPLERTTLAHIAARFGAHPRGMTLDIPATTRLQAITITGAPR